MGYDLQHAIDCLYLWNVTEGAERERWLMEAWRALSQIPD